MPAAFLSGVCDSGADFCGGVAATHPGTGPSGGALTWSQCRADISPIWRRYRAVTQPRSRRSGSPDQSPGQQRQYADPPVDVETRRRCGRGTVNVHLFGTVGGSDPACELYRRQSLLFHLYRSMLSVTTFLLFNSGVIGIAPEMLQQLDRLGWFFDRYKL